MSIDAQSADGDHYVDDATLMSMTTPQPPIVPGPAPQPSEPEPPATPPSTPNQRRGFPQAAVALVTILAVLLLGAAAYKLGIWPTKAGGPTPTGTSAPVVPVVTPAKPDYTPPAVADFTLTVKILEQKCFGSAGCNVTYRIEVASYAGPGIEPGVTWDVTYTVTGGDDPQINTLHVTRGDSDMSINVSTQREERIGTPNATSVLTAIVTAVSAG